MGGAGYGPTQPISIEIQQEKHRQPSESFREAMGRQASTLTDSEVHYKGFMSAIENMRFLPAGRIQAAIGSTRKVTPYNCFVSQTIDDSMAGIMDTATRAAMTMRMGGGIGYDFSTLRPRLDTITSLMAPSSGPVSFMSIFDAICGTISSAGNRRGAQMGTLRVDHPNIEEFIRSKQNTTNLRNFNISIAITDKFMKAVIDDSDFDLKFEGRVYSTIRALPLWKAIMASTWDWAEPGVLFIDRINDDNNLRYAETIAATNPCAEQPLPPNGACLLGSFNLVKYITGIPGIYAFDWDQLCRDIPFVVRAMDNVIDNAIYPLPEQEAEALAKRRMGLGVTGVANALEALGLPYGSKGFVEFLEKVLKLILNETYWISSWIARDKGAFPLFDFDEFSKTTIFNKLYPYVQDNIRQFGLRNSHLTSIAPTGSISLAADNVSSGIEPVFALKYTRDVLQLDKTLKKETVYDYGMRVFGVKGKTAAECTIDDHLDVLLASQKWVDSAVSKTCNIGDDVTFNEFTNVYMKAWRGGAKGCTTFRASGKRMGILNVSESTSEDIPDIRDGDEEGTQCFIDPSTGRKTCDE